MNIVAIDGRLTRDPEGKTTNSGKFVANISIANNEGYGDNKKTTYIDVEVWGRVAENCCAYLSKGDMVAIEGKLFLESWEDKEGKTQRRHKIKYARVEFKETKPKQEVTQIARPINIEEPTESNPFSDDDIPF